MSLVAAAIVPVVLVLLAGAALRRRVLRDAGFWHGLEWMSYRVFTPALFVTSIAKTDLAAVPFGFLAVGVAAPICFFACVVIALRQPMRANGPQLTSLVQGSIRINTYIGLVLASAMHGPAGVASFALASAIAVPLVNVICVSTLVRYGNRATQSKWKPLWRELLENPLIQGCAVGIGANLAGNPQPTFVVATLTLLAAPALACGTLIAGAALSFNFRRRDILDIGVSSVLKLVALPLSAATIALSLGMTGPPLTSVVLLCAVPAAPSAYVLASRMGGDARLMASITGVQTVLSMATLPGMLELLTHLGQRAR